MALQLGWTQAATATERSLEGQPLSIMEFESPSAAVIADPVPLGSRSAIWWLSAMMFLFLMIAAFVPQDIVVSANGKVVSTAATVVVQPLDQSIIKTINVRVGQIVKKGDLLATLDSTLTGADVTAYKAAVSGLTPMVKRLIAEKNHQTYTADNPKDTDQELQQKLFEQRKALRIAANANYDQQIASLEQQISGNLASAEYYRQRLGIAGDVEGLRRQEEQLQVGSKLNSLEAADTRVSMEASMDQAIASAQAEKATLQATQAQKASDQATFDAATMQSISDNEGLLTTAQQNLDKSNMHGGLVYMRALQDAFVLQVEKLSVGSVLQPGEQFIQLSPLDQPLEVEAYISGTDIGWVQPGNYVQLKFDTFMYQEYGDARGHVVSVTIDGFTQPSGGSSSAPIQVSTGASDPSQTPSQGNTMSPVISVFYVARIAIDRVALKHIPKDFRLIPGMPLSADIKVGWRTYMDYMFARVAPVFHEAMREP